MITHTVVFRLRHAPGSSEEAVFLKKAGELAAIPAVLDFKVYRQVSEKNNYHFGLFMNFSSATEYQQYNEHPNHVSFVQTVWLTEVEDFMELDYEEM